MNTLIEAIAATIIILVALSQSACLMTDRGLAIGEKQSRMLVEVTRINERPALQKIDD